ncbi:MAG TPA: efflux RND transporter periplasmic adaptor subunit [Terriglobia bacterium]|nr:efflux RND transporter periplasmic adaptor subunit [Terriglobia bacterium]
MSTELNKLRIDRSQRGEAREGGGKGKWIALFIILLLLAGGGIAGYSYWSRKQVIVVDTARPRLESTTDSAVLVATGYVVAHHKIQVGSKISGRVAWIGVEKGDHVDKDQVVVRLEDREYRAQYEQTTASYDSAVARLSELERGSRPEEIERAKAELDRANAQLRADDANFKRIDSMVKQGVGASQLLDDAKGRYDASRAAVASATKTYELTQLGPRKEQVDNARSEVARAKAAAEYAKSILDSTEIHVPTSGTILERNVEQGEMVTTSFVGAEGAKGYVVTIADLNDIQVELDINQNDFNRIAADQPCTAVSDAYPDKVYKCRVSEIAPEANRQKATIQVKVKFLEPDKYVKPEMNARVTFLAAKSASKAAEKPEASQKLYVIPKSAVQERGDGKIVFVLSGDGLVQSRPITVAREVGADAYVSAGLSGSESVIIGEMLKQVKVGDHVEMRK